MQIWKAYTHQFVWKKSTTKYEIRNLNKLDTATKELSNKYGIFCSDADEFYSLLTGKVTEPFVYGRGHRKSELQRDIETLKELLSKREKYAEYQKTFKGRNSFSKTDHDATFMHMKEDHMRNSQLKPGYNIRTMPAYCGCAEHEENSKHPLEEEFATFYNLL